jgi:ElaA protein
VLSPAAGDLNPTMKVTWSWQSFNQLSPSQLYDLLKLRQRVFVVEQNCVYLDLDGIDHRCWHGMGHTADGALAAYARVVPPLLKFPGPSIGRVVTAPEFRRRGIGADLMAQALGRTRQLFPGQTIHIAAQAQLEAFYRRLGFVVAGFPYDDDGIRHVDMTTT